MEVDLAQQEVLDDGGREPCLGRIRHAENQEWAGCLDSKVGAVILRVLKSGRGVT